MTQNYVKLIDRILGEGEERLDRTGVGTRSIFGAYLEFDLRERFPLISIKETRYQVAFLEMLWFLRGECHTEYLLQHGCKLWQPWADEENLVGPIYGVQWRSWEAFPENSCSTPIDQIKALIDGIKSNPTGRRHLVSAWNVADIPSMGLPPCHFAFQCYASNDNHLDLQLHIRSSDVALGLPFNIAQYALLLTLLARATHRQPRYLKVTLGDAHLYVNHIPAMCEVIQRPVPNDKPVLEILTHNIDIDKYKPEDFSIQGYEPLPFVKLPVAV